MFLAHRAREFHRFLNGISGFSDFYGWNLF
jgi:hypothetical protein